MDWVKELLTNSCDVNLVKCIDKKFDCLAEYEQGGITYLKIALDEMYMMSDMVIMSLQHYHPFFIPIWMNPMAISIVNCWGDRKSEVVDLTKHWLKITL